MIPELRTQCWFVLGLRNTFNNICGFSPYSIATRINDCESDYVITADEGARAGKIIHLKSITDEALVECPRVKKCIVVKRTGNRINWDESRDVWYHEND